MKSIYKGLDIFPEALMTGFKLISDMPAVLLK